MENEEIALTKAHMNSFKEEMEARGAKLSIECLNAPYLYLDMEQSFDLTREIFTLNYTDVKPLAFFEAMKSNLSIKDRIKDYASEMYADDIPEEFLLTNNDDERLYLSGLNRRRDIQHVGDQVLIKVTQALELRGQDYNSILKDIDMSQFVERHYDLPKDSIKPGFDITDNPVMILAFDGKAKITSRIDAQLFKSWAVHQLTKKVFKCTYDPFFERDGLIHAHADGRTAKSPTYDMPSNFNYFAYVNSLNLCEEYVSFQNILAK